MYYKGYRIRKRKKYFLAESTEGLKSHQSKNLNKLKEKIDQVQKNISLRAFVNEMKSEFSLTPWELIYQCVKYNVETIVYLDEINYPHLIFLKNKMKWVTTSHHEVTIYFQIGDSMPDHCDKYIEKIEIGGDKSKNFYPVIKEIADENKINLVKLPGPQG